MVPVANTTTRLVLSQAGVGVAQPFSELGVFPGRLMIGIGVRQSCLPERRSRAMTAVSLTRPPSMVALVRKSLSPQITGELFPPPSISAFHKMLESVLQTSG